MTARSRGWIAWVLLFTLPSCSPATRDRLMHFFFEIPENVASTDPGEEPAEPPVELAAARSALAPVAAPRFRSVHAPVSEQSCRACHDAQRRMDAPAEWMMTSCRSCHTRYFGTEVGHPPVAYQFCAACHTPHRSEQPDLLIKPAFNLCMDCHPAPEELSPRDHGDPGVQNCTRCHDPHFGEGKLLR